MKFYLLILLLVYLLFSCTNVKFDNPLDSKGENYIGDEAFLDDDKDGVPNYKDIDSEYYIYKSDSNSSYSSINISLGFVNSSIYYEALSPVDFSYKIVSKNKLKALYYKFSLAENWQDSLKTNIADSGTITHVFSSKGIYEFVVKAVDEKMNINYDTLSCIVYQKGADTIAPVISLKSVSSVEISLNNKWVEPGYVAIDNIEGDISSRVVVRCVDASNNEVDINSFSQKVGSYKLIYTVMDLDGNISTSIRTVNVVASSNTNQPPQIALKGDSVVTIAIKTPYIEKGATAFDVEDGDISDSIKIDSSGLDTTKVGIYLISYSVKDKNGHVATIYRKVLVKDIDILSPVITLNGLESYSLQKGVDWKSFEPGYEVTDNIDTGLVNSVIVTVTNGLDTLDINNFTNNPGSYLIIYSVKDNSGNVAESKTRTITIKNIEVVNTKPVISLVGDSVVNCVLNDKYEEKGAIAFDPEDGDISSSIVINGTVNTAVAGTYVLYYIVTDNGGLSDTTQRKVLVDVDDEPPKLTLNGGDVSVLLGDKYKEPGYSAFDNYAGDLKDSVKVTIKDSKGNVVVIDSIGTKVEVYTITYSVKDNAGNLATKTRTVTVAEDINIGTGDNNVDINLSIANTKRIVIDNGGQNFSQLEIYFDEASTPNISFNIDGKEVKPSTNDHGRLYTSVSSTNKLEILITVTDTSTISKVHWW